MKQRDLVKKMEAAGFRFKEHGGNHDTYKRGTKQNRFQGTKKSMR